MRRVAGIKAWVEEYDAVVKEVEDLRLMPEFVKEGVVTEQELDEQYARAMHRIEELELRNMLRRDEDRMGAIMDINSGAGGTEALDWAGMLLRMYTRWGEAHGYKVKVLDYQAGEEVGVKSCTLEFEGEYAYGYLKSENGVHRLVRVSPFDANARRQTSFAALEVMPELPDDIEVEIRPEDIEMQVYRASGAGGQHVNKTSSAVRLIHKPTGMIAECQEERSQFQNREKAMRLLASRLYEAEREKRESAYDAERRSQVGSGDRSQRIRTYNFPQGRVTDHRIGLTLYKIDAIMDGALDELIDALVTADQAEKLKQGQEAE